MSEKDFVKHLHMNTMQQIIIYVLFVIQTVSVISDIIAIKVILFSIKQNVYKNNKRAKILMTNIAYSGLLMTIGSCYSLFIVVPVLVNTGQPLIISIVQSMANYFNALSLYVISISITVLSCDQYF